MAVALICTSCKEDNWMDWKLQNELWLEQNAKAHEDDPQFHISETGLQYRILSYGNVTDAKPSVISTINCNYTLRLINGNVVETANNASFNLSSQLIAGFIEGAKLVHVHGDVELFIPYDLGYKEDGSGNEGSQTGVFIPPYSTLIYTLHINSVN